MSELLASHWTARRLARTSRNAYHAGSRSGYSSWSSSPNRRKAPFPLTQRLLASGERVLDVPAKRAARARVFDTGQGRKTDAADAHAIVMVALRDKGLREVSTDPELMVLRMLCDRRDELSRARTQALNRLHRLFLDLLPGGAPVKKSVSQYQALLATVRPRDLAGKTRRRMAAEELEDLHRLDAKLKAMKAELKAAVRPRVRT